MDADAAPSDPTFTGGYLAPGASESAGLSALVDDAAIRSVEQQDHVSELHGEDAWGVDAGAQTFTFTAPDGTALVCRAHLLGSAAPGPGSWLWGWVNANGFPDAFFARAAEVRDSPAAAAVPELTTSELPLTQGLPLRLTLAAKAITGLPIHYAAPVGGGTRVWVLLEQPSLELPAPTVLRTLSAITVTIDTIQLTDGRRAVRSWAAQRGAAVTGEDELHLTVSDGEVVVRFDELGRIARVAGEARGDDEPTAAPAPVPSPEPGPSPVPPETPAPPAAAEAPDPQPRGFLSRLLGRRD